MTVLIIDKKTQEAVTSLRKFVEDPDNFIYFERVVKMFNGEMKPVGDNPDYVCYLNSDYRCVYSIEEQELGLLKHLSISINKKGKYPNQQAVEVILELFGFKGGILEQINVWLEKENESVNVLGYFNQILGMIKN